MPYAIQSNNIHKNIFCLKSARKIRIFSLRLKTNISTSLMLCLHLSFYQSKKLLRSSYLTLVHQYIVSTGSNNSSWSVSPRARREIELARILKPCRASGSKVVAFVAIAIYFLIARTATSIFHKLLMLQHLKRLRREWKILLQITLRNIRRVWLWPRNQFWVESLLQGDFLEEWWKQNFRISM